MKPLLRMMAVLWLGLHLTGAVAETRCDDPRPLRIGFIPKSDAQHLRDIHQPLLQRLRWVLQRPVELVPASSYGAVAEGLLAGQIDVAELGPATYALVMQRQRDAVAPFASVAAQGQSGVATYQSVLVVHGDTGFDDVRALRGRSVALIDPASTSGALLPRQSVAELTGRDLDQHFKSVTYTGSHDRAIQAVSKRLVDAAFVSSSRLTEAERLGRLRPGELRVIWRSVAIPRDPFVYRMKLCAPVREAIARTFFSGDAALRPLLDALDSPAFVPVSDKDYAAVRERLEALR